MKEALNYEHKTKIELINEFSHKVYSRLLSFVEKDGIESNDKNNVYIHILEQFSKMLDINLYELTIEELEVIAKYWKHMNSFIKEINEEDYRKLMGLNIFF
ncbi:hypothetical protein [Metabacillus malikii]|uniref:Antitoxin epsilon/PezA domain-containing protein n=1 Tax=Metabacillus malikii TaxID=1504265 RepID=A0ABT9ZE87_9BACI|nr:hypothetical protein [Metabacillus malikii]MDQ0230136.1 hypothetical protein [Metabacillus malikii]